MNLVGRTGPGARDGPAHLDQVKAVKLALPHVTIITNGNVITYEDAIDNLKLTGADGVMSAEGILDNPALFANEIPGDARRLHLALEYLELVNKYPTTMKSIVFHVRRMCAEVLLRFQLLDDCLRAASAEEVQVIVEQALRYVVDGGFVYDSAKEKLMRETLQNKEREEGKRKEYEQRMIRKAKREGKPLDHYLLIGAEPPSIEFLKHLRTLKKEEAFALWKEKYVQHCFAFHFDSCARDRRCAFLHADATMAESLSYG